MLFYLTKAHSKGFRAAHRLAAKLGGDARVVADIHLENNDNKTNIFIIDSNYQLSDTKRLELKNSGEIVVMKKLEEITESSFAQKRNDILQAGELATFYTNGREILESSNLRNVLCQIINPFKGSSVPQLLRWGHKEIKTWQHQKIQSLITEIKDLTEISAESRDELLRIWYALETLDPNWKIELEDCRLRGDGINFTLESTLSWKNDIRDEMPKILPRLAGISSATVLLKIQGDRTVRLCIHRKLDLRQQTCQADQGAIVIYRDQVDEEQKRSLWNKAG